MQRLAVVPARAGSKRLPGKNIRILGGKPLVNHTVEVARRCFDLVIVSSDSADILAVIEPAPNVKCLLRPSGLSTDQSKVVATVSFYYDQFDESHYDQIWLCLPTCPLRTSSEVLAGQNLLTKEVDGVISVAEYEFPPSLGLRMDHGLLKEIDPALPLSSGNSRSQDHAGACRPNGAFYGMWWTSFGKHRNFFQGKVRGYLMPRERSVDIDTEWDFAVAEFLLGKVAPQP